MLKVAFAVVLAAAAMPAWAGDRLLRGSTPEWVMPITASPPPATEGDGPPVRILLEDKQLHLGSDGQSEFIRTVTQIRSPMGLGAAGSISLAWSPDVDTLTVHHFRILRGAQTLDVLAKQDFAVLRRETNLELDMLDGVLSATLQPEGVQVGDVIDIAYTRRRLDPVLYGRTYGRADRLHLRVLWDSGREITWRAGSGLDKPKVTRSGGQTDVTVDMKDVETIKFPAGAPQRFYPTRDLTVSEFKTWADVAALMAPHYTKASQLAPSSTLRIEIERIRKASPDPAVRAGLALQLVEDQIRYLAITLQNGGYVPATADETWRRRYGDCKAKTALLVALLRELGIEAEAALVDSDGGAGLATRLPGVSAFDHVIVRATIGGKVYWLDGTRSGDRDIELLRVPRLGHALPVRAADAALVALLQPTLERPDSGVFLKVDASRGIEAPAPVRGELILGGDMGHYMTLYSAAMPAAERNRALKAAFGAYPWIEPKTVSMTTDPATGQAKLIMEGTGKLAWQPKSNGPRWLHLPGATLGGGGRVKREPGPGADAPWVVPGHPSWLSSRFEVVLPEAGEGFRIEGIDVDKIVAGRAYLRKSKIEKGVATIETSIRTVAEEIPNSEVAAASDLLTEMAKVRVAVRAPPYYRPTAEDIATWFTEAPKTAADYIGRGVRYASVGQYDNAIADLNNAISVDPKSSYAWANRANSYFHTGKHDLAAADYAKAIELDPRNYVAVQGQGTLAMRQRRYADAAAAYARAADLRPGNVFALSAQARALWLLGDSDKALTLLDQALTAEPGDLSLRLVRYRILEARNERERALAEVDAALKVSAENSSLHLYRGGVLARMGRSSEAHAAFDRAIALRPTQDAYLTRMQYRHPGDIVGRLADVELAEKLGPEPLAATRAEILGDAGRYDEALAAIDRALKLKPDKFALAADRAELLLRAGRTSEASRAIERLRVQAAGDAERLNGLCWMAATRNHALNAALRDCDAALKIEPDSGPAADSRALVLLRLNRAPDALAAYDLAVKLMPANPESLYGRGLVRLKMGRPTEAAVDLAAARAGAPFIDVIFDGWGLRASEPKD